MVFDWTDICRNNLFYNHIVSFVVLIHHTQPKFSSQMIYKL